MTDHDKLMQQRATWTDLVKRLHDFVLKVSLVFSCKKMYFKCRPLLLLNPVEIERFRVREELVQHSADRESSHLSTGAKGSIIGMVWLWQWKGGAYFA
jgi:hypothetical protein